MGRARATIIFFLILIALIALAIFAYDSGYTVGKDIAERENAEEGR